MQDVTTVRHCLQLGDLQLFSSRKPMFSLIYQPTFSMLASKSDREKFLSTDVKKSQQQIYRKSCNSQCPFVSEPVRLSVTKICRADLLGQFVDKSSSVDNT